VITVKVYDDAGTCVSVHEAHGGGEGPRAVIDALQRALRAEAKVLPVDPGAGDHHHEQRSVLGMTLAQVAGLIMTEKIPITAVFDALPGDMPMIPGPNGEGDGECIIEPVLSWTVAHDGE
jgi:hypothetical protein